MRVKANLDDWTSSNQKCLDTVGVGGTGGYDLSVVPGGGITVSYRAAADDRVVTSNALGFTDGTTHEFRATFDQSAGSGTYFMDGKSFDSDTGMNTDAGVGGRSLRVGQSLFTSSPVFGGIFWVEIRDGIDGPIVARC